MYVHIQIHLYQYITSGATTAAYKIRGVEWSFPFCILHSLTRWQDKGFARSEILDATLLTLEHEFCTCQFSRTPTLCWPVDTTLMPTAGSTYGPQRTCLFIVQRVFLTQDGSHPPFKCTLRPNVSKPTRLHWRVAKWFRSGSWWIPECLRLDIWWTPDYLQLERLWTTSWSGNLKDRTLRYTKKHPFPASQKCSSKMSYTFCLHAKTFVLLCYIWNTFCFHIQ